MNQFTLAGPDELPWPASSLPAFEQDAAKAFELLGELAREGPTTLAAATEGDRQRAAELLRRHGLSERVTLVRQLLGRGFRWLEAGKKPMSVVPEHELLHRTGARRRRGAPVQSVSGDRVRDAFLAFEPGDYVTHRDHGVARYIGLTQLAKLKQILHSRFFSSSSFYIWQVIQSNQWNQVQIQNCILRPQKNTRFG